MFMHEIPLMRDCTHACSQHDMLHVFSEMFVFLPKKIPEVFDEPSRNLLGVRASTMLLTDGASVLG